MSAATPIPIDRASRLQIGIQFEDFVTEVLFRERRLVVIPYRSAKWQGERGENAQGVEIKLDQKFRETGNLFIETSECWQPGQSLHRSGVTDGKSWLYAIGDYQTIWLLSTKLTLQTIEKLGLREVRGGIDRQTSTGRLLPVTLADRICLWRWDDPGATP